ncbi:MAG: DUF2164 domain-containing protein [Gemmatimonadetes bacterium]|nr:DUF2164 domain-containing protein [Gemmatimonadota bacterium]
MAIQLDDARREQLIRRLQGFFLKELDEDLSRFRAEQILDFHLDALGPQVYNQAVQDARKFMQERLDDLDAEVHVPEPLP